MLTEWTLKWETWKCQKLKVSETESVRKWFWPNRESVRNGKCRKSPNWKVSENFKIGKCQQLKVSEFQKWHQVDKILIWNSVKSIFKFYYAIPEFWHSLVLTFSDTFRFWLFPTLWVSDTFWFWLFLTLLVSDTLSFWHFFLKKWVSDTFSFWHFLFPP